MDEFHFLRPYWLLAIVPALLLCRGILRRQDVTASWGRTFDPHLLPFLLVSDGNKRRWKPVHLLLVVWILCSVALAGPTWKKTPSPFADDEAGLMVLLEVTGTMMATDVQPSRLERAKHKIRDLLEIRRGMATGLIVYSGSAHLVMPLTRDDRIITAMIDELTPDLMPSEGDALANAVTIAENIFSVASGSGSILLMTDSISPTQVNALSEKENQLPLQILVTQSPSAPVDAGVERLSDLMRAPVVRVTPDDADVRQIANRAESKLVSIFGLETGEAWDDFGYSMAGLIAVCALMWSRKGWVVRCD
jgi:Ca-activated chloride channel family protein